MHFLISKTGRMGTTQIQDHISVCKIHNRSECECDSNTKRTKRISINARIVEREYCRFTGMGKNKRGSCSGWNESCFGLCSYHHSICIRIRHCKKCIGFEMHELNWNKYLSTDEYDLYEDKCQECIKKSNAYQRARRRRDSNQRPRYKRCRDSSTKPKYKRCRFK